MFRAMIYFAGFATLSASAAYALVVAHDTLGPEHQASSPAVVARAAPVKQAPAAPLRIQPVASYVAPEPLAAGTIIKHEMTATATSLRPKLRFGSDPVQALPVRTASTDPFQGIERLNPSDLRADVAVMTFQGETGQGETGGQSSAGGDRSAPVTTYKPIRISNPYVARSAPATPDQRLANNWNVGVYR